jgi:hypothetical protein
MSGGRAFRTRARRGLCLCALCVIDSIRSAIPSSSMGSQGEVNTPSPLVGESWDGGRAFLSSRNDGRLPLLSDDGRAAEARWQEFS